MCAVEDSRSLRRALGSGNGLASREHSFQTPKWTQPSCLGQAPSRKSCRSGRGNTFPQQGLLSGWSRNPCITNSSAFTTGYNHMTNTAV